MADSYDVVIIGSGPGGYVAALRAAQLGLTVALVEKNRTLGGTCLNIGCIPSKALLHSTEIFHFMQEKGAAHGLQAEKLAIDLNALMKQKDASVSRLVKGVETLCQQRKVDLKWGLGRIRDAHTVAVEGEKSETLSAKNIIIATGSSSIELPFLKFDGKAIVSSDHALSLPKIPEKMVVVGAGAIGLELGSVWSRMGSKVTVVEFLPRVAPTFDADISKMAQRVFKKQGLTFALETKVTGYDKKKKLLTAENKKGEEVTFEADVVLVAVGRKPHTDSLGLSEAGVEVDEKGRVQTDAHFRTNVEGIYAIGDVKDGPMLAHKAEDEGVACVELIAGKAGHVNYAAIPNVIYTAPEIASVGLSEEEAKAQGREVSTGRFPLTANGRAIAMDETDGIIKTIADKKTDRLLGVHMIAANASELIAAAVTHIEYGGSAEDLGRTATAHPTLGEALKEAGLAAGSGAIHAL